MKHFLDLVINSSIFFIILFFSIIVALIYISVIINKYVYDVFKLLLVVYMIYFPVGVFMGTYYWITTKNWFS
ncbi:MAG: hypothetical protein Q8936_20865, partial [Bacillota bacterium]|nr:hypothetical protein [Bacillota bacterium]